MANKSRPVGIAERKEKWAEEEFKVMCQKWSQWMADNPKASKSEQLMILQRLYEKKVYGITSRDLTLGKSVDYVEVEPGVFKKVEADCRGYFITNSSNQSVVPECHFERTRFDIVNNKRFTYREMCIDAKEVKNNRDEMIALAATQETTIRDVDADGTDSFLESGVETGFGTTAGVVPPVFINMLLELTSLRAFMKNFIAIQPMPDMTFKFPLKTSKIEDSAEFQRTAVPTVEGRAGTEYHTEWANYEINGWKYLRHAELTNEIAELLDRFIPVTQTFVNDLAEGQALLWDYAAHEGIQTMIVKGLWRYPRLAAGAFTWTEDGANEIEIPFGKASVLTSNAKLNYLWQDLAGGTHDGKIYEPNAGAGAEFQWTEVDPPLRAGSTGSDEILEGIGAIGSLLKEKHSKLEYVILTDSRLTERLFRDSRIADMTVRTGDPVFQSEDGYLGQVAVAGSSTFVDIWEAPANLIPFRATDDTTGGAKNAYPIICGAYGKGWHQGVFSPVSMRVDEGFEVVDEVADLGRLRPSESKVLTTSSKGSTWPGDYNHISILWGMLDTGHD